MPSWWRDSLRARTNANAAKAPWTATSGYPRECCGLVVMVARREVYMPCRNTAASADHFVLAADDYAAAEDAGRIVAIVHSHPDETPTPSEADRVACEATGLPWFIVAVAKDDDGAVVAGEVRGFTPVGFQAPLLGRQFAHGVLDCYSLVRDPAASGIGVRGQASADAGPILEQIGGKIEKSMLGQDLITEIESGGGAATEIKKVKDGLNAMVSIKAQSTGPDGKLYAAGMGVGVENTPEGMQTQVLFLADRLALINLANGVVSTPFAIQNGQTFISQAFIQDGTITSAKIGEYIQSNNFVAGQQGWRWSKSGAFENNGVGGGGRRVENNTQSLWYDANGTLRIRIQV